MSVRETLENNPLLDVAILSHGFSPHVRDYDFVIEAMWGSKEWGDAKGRYLCRFSHCPIAHVETSLSDQTWQQSWADLFIDYADWEKHGEPEGFVWGVNWSLAYPGVTYVVDSALAVEWSRRFGKEMHEAIVKTNSFKVRLVFHDFAITKLSDEVEIVDRILFPLKK